jgi:ABC-type nickel/cobalt efflux system permease component RcnA
VTDPHDPRVTAYLAQKADALKAALSLTIDGHPVTLETVSEDVIFPPGAGGLPTMKIGVVYRAMLFGNTCAASLCTLEYHDGNLPDRAGWKEVVVTADAGVTLHSSSAPAVSRSHELINYPTDLINSPPQDLSARLTFVTTLALAATSASTLPGASAGPTHSAATLGAESKGVAMSAPVSPMTSAGSVHAAAPHVTNPVVSAPLAVSKSRSTVTLPDHTTSAGAAGSEPAKLALKGNEQHTPRNRFTELIATHQWGLWFLLSAALIAAALGGLHALEPGHGKTIVAAYLVGSQGTAAHALWLGLVVTVTHTAGVYALGLITLYASKYIVPDHLYPWLGVTSGFTVAALGLYMLRRRFMGHALGHTHSHDGHSHDGHSHDGHSHHHGWFGHSHNHSTAHEHEHAQEHSKHSHVHSERDHDHSHAPDHSHQHHDHQNQREHPHSHTQQAAKPFSYRQLIALGVTGGIVPCPAALVVLLSAVSLHRVAFGLYLILAFSLGLAAVLISIGLVTVYARRLLARVPTDGPVINRWLPMASAAVITCLGLAIVFQGLVSMGLVHFRV